MIGCLRCSCLLLIVDAIEVSQVVDCVSSVDSVSSELELGLIEMLVAVEPGFDSGIGSIGIVAVCGLLIAVMCARMW